MDQVLNQAINRLKRVCQSIFGDLSYKPLNTFNSTQKKKIFQYLRAKFLYVNAEAQQGIASSFTYYSIQDIQRKVKIAKTLSDHKAVWQASKSALQSAKDALTKLEKSQSAVQAQYTNQVAFQFDRQQQCSILWGLLFGAAINGTLLKTLSVPKRGAFFLTIGYAFGQIGFRANVERYFDAIYPIFETDAIKFAAQERDEIIREEIVKPKGKHSLVILDDQNKI